MTVRNSGTMQTEGNTRIDDFAVRIAEYQIHIYIYMYVCTRHVFKVRSGEPLKITHKR